MCVCIIIVQKPIRIQTEVKGTSFCEKKNLNSSYEYGNNSSVSNIPLPSDGEQMKNHEKSRPSLASSQAHGLLVDVC